MYPELKTVLWILHMYPPLNNAGAEGMAHTLNRYLISCGWNVIVAIPNFPYKTFEHVKFINFNNKKEVNLAIQHTSIIISHLKFSEYGVRKASEFNKPIILLMHNSFQISYLRNFLTILPDPTKLHLIHNSEWIDKFYSTKFKIDGEILYPPVFADDVIVKSNSRKFITLVNCTKEKGGEILIKLAKLWPSFKFMGVLGGYGKQIVEKGLDNLKYMEHTSNPKDFYSQSDIIIMPSEYESWGRVAVEAMMNGIPVIASPTPGLKESLNDVGIFVECDDINGWVKQINELKNNPWLYSLKSEEGLIRANNLNEISNKQLYNVEKWIDTLKIVKK